VSEPVWINEHDARTVHDRLLAQHGGAAGVRDSALLQSALARPQQLNAYGDKPDMIEMAAAYTAGIVRNHPFIDGNKRTGLMVGAMFLELNSHRFTAGEEEATRVVRDLAAGTLDERGFTTWMRENTERSRELTKEKSRDDDLSAALKARAQQKKREDRER
jgi:death on curing protein